MKITKEGDLTILGEVPTGSRLKEKFKEIKIEIGVPIPADYGRNNGKWASLFTQMREGDSVLLNSRKEAHTFVNSVFRCREWKIKTRTEGTKVRCWKVPRKVRA